MKMVVSIIYGVTLAGAAFLLGTVTGDRIGYERGVLVGRLKGDTDCLIARMEEATKKNREATERLKSLYGK